MALIIDETFAASLPGGFATMQAVSGQPATYNAAAQAVDIGSGVSSYFNWKLNVAAMAAFSVEWDVEAVSFSYSGKLHMFTANKGAGSGNAISSIYIDQANAAPRPKQFHFYAWPATFDNSSVFFVSSYPVRDDGANKNFLNAAGERKVFRVEWSAAQNMMRLFVDGVIALTAHGKANIDFANDTGLPGIGGYGCVLRVHSVKLWDTADFSDVQLGVAPVKVHDQLATQAVAYASGAPAAAFVRDPHFMSVASTDGGTISGTVVTDTDPLDTPTAARVDLLDDVSGVLVASTISRPADGYYEFRRLDRNRRYSVATRDPVKLKAPVIKSDLTPV